MFFVNRPISVVTTCLHLDQTLATSTDYINTRVTDIAHIQTRNETL